jgi:hypothetical protein
MYARYRNKGARHTYERETKNQMNNIQRVDELIEHRKGLRHSTIDGRNDNNLEGENIGLQEKLLNQIKK